MGRKPAKHEAAPAAPVPAPVSSPPSAAAPSIPKPTRPGMIPLSQVLSDLGVADGQKLPASSASGVAARVKEKLERMSAVHEVGPHKGSPVDPEIGFCSPIVALKPTADLDVVTLHVTASVR
jgi:hypothetical protein